MSDPRDQLQADLADRYRLERELGRGGMATVYLAHDLRHDRQVALKVLRPELAHALGPERFLREIKLAARLQHPHILTLHDSGDAAGQLWYTMPYIDGESLRDRIRRERQLPIAEALRISREVADALGYAHGQGVIHRDIKPENILLSQGHALVADFGIARAVQTSAGQHLTETGSSVGTPAYMSPEQSMGDSALDGRSDLYSLGCVLYEMLTGEAPHSGSSAHAIISKRLLDPVPVASRLRQAIPPEVDQALQRALAKAPADRFASAEEFAQSLSGSASSTPASTRIAAAPPAESTLPPGTRRVPGIVIAVGLGVLLGLGLLFAFLRTRSGADPAGPRRVAVLPFENLGRLEDAYFADGVTDAVRGKLAALPNLQVTARSSSSQYKQTTKSSQQIGRELGVEYLLTGTVRWAKGAGEQSRVQVSPELVQVATASTKWQQPFDAALTDVFQVQADIAGRVAEALGVALEASQKATLETKPTTNPAAYDYYLRGNDAFNKGIAEATLRAAAGLYEKAVEVDSTFALAFAQLSLADDAMYWTYHDRSELRLVKQKEAADRALRIQPDLAEGHLALGFYYYHGLLDYDRALQEFEAARARQPSNGSTYLGLASIHRRQGRWSEALQEGKKSVELNPLSYTDLRSQGLTEMSVRAYPEAEQYLNRAIDVSPDEGDAYVIKYLLYVLWRGDTISAARAIRQGVAKAGVEQVAPALYSALDGPLTLQVMRELFDSAVAQVPVEAFGSDTVGSLLYLAERHVYGPRPKTARVYLDSARVVLEAQVDRYPDDPVFHARLGATDAKLGRNVEAIREGEKAVSLGPLSQGAIYRLHLAWILARAGQADAAIDQLTYLLSVPSYVSVPALRVDHSWDPLRGNPRFERLLQEPKR